MPSSIPVVDIEDLRSGDPERLDRAAAALLQGFGEYGLVFIRNHGLDREDVLETYDRFLEVLDRPESEKASWGGPEIWYQRGWTPPNTEQAVVAGGQPDFKECFFAAPLPVDEMLRDAYPQVYCDNVWPDDAEAFQSGMMHRGGAIHGIGLDLLRGCARGLGLAEDTFAEVVERGAHVTRILKYLPLDKQQAASDILWGEEHTDFNLLTLLPGGNFYWDGKRSDRPEQAGGLSLRTRPTADEPRGKQLPGRAPEGCIIAQVGQQLEVLTGGRFLATPHVIRPPKEAGWTRVSLAHFVHLRGDVPVSPLAPLRTAEAVRAYAPPVLAGTYTIKTLVDIGLAPKSELEKLGYRHYGRLADWRAEED